MVLEFNQVNEILKKQPIGYYVGRAIKTTLKNCNSSYYSLSTDEIIISYPQLIKVFAKLAADGDPIESKTAVRIIRTILYHEVGHAMLTPKEMTEVLNYHSWYDKDYYDALNIVEDERLEMILDGFIKNVNFKEVVEACNEVGSSHTALGQFFDLVRFNVYEEDWSERVDDLLVKYCTLIHGSDNYDTSSYVRELFDLYSDYKSTHEMEGTSDNGAGSNTDDQDNQQDPNSNSDSDSPSIDDLEEELSKGNAQDLASSEALEMIKEILDNLNISDEELTNFEKLIDEVANEEPIKSDHQSRQVGPSKKPEVLFKESTELFNDDKLYQELSRIFNSVNKVHKSNSAAVNAYSGVLDPRSAGRDDRRMFLQRNRDGHSKAFSKVHLNLFLDRSGSFYYNQLKANQIIHTLSKIEKMNPNFSYTLITVGNTPRIEDKKNIYFIADGGNDLPDSVPVVFKQVQERSCVNYNLVLFDGYVCWDSYNKPNWGAFNTNNTLIISDPDNEADIERWCPNARSIITTNYTDELTDNIIKVLGSIVR